MIMRKEGIATDLPILYWWWWWRWWRFEGWSVSVSHGWICGLDMSLRTSGYHGPRTTRRDETRDIHGSWNLKVGMFWIASARLSGLDMGKYLINLNGN